MTIAIAIQLSDSVSPSLINVTTLRTIWMQMIHRRELIKNAGTLAAVLSLPSGQVLAAESNTARMPLNNRTPNTRLVAGKWSNSDMQAVAFRIKAQLPPVPRFGFTPYIEDALESNPQHTPLKPFTWVYHTGASHHIEVMAGMKAPEWVGISWQAVADEYWRMLHKLEGLMGRGAWSQWCIEDDGHPWRSERVFAVGDI